ncbi:peptidase M24, structural domain-containing protein [Pelagophyceae sp. CCMP2097]|nr:peptidase M24, structural domain-containing protein [Pelagophyceae sp. CCMP2097]
MKLAGMRVLVKSFGLDAYIIPSGDAHSSEYVASCDERRAWLTGFTGSAGTALVTLTEALVWTDGRYFNQAATQLEGSPWTLMKQGEPGVPGLEEWCAGKRVGIHASLATVGFADEFALKSGADVVSLDAPNFVDMVWSRRRPKVPCNAVVPQPLALSGESVASKLRRVSAALRGDALCMNALDQIAWLTNLRGSDIECNPVFFAYAVVSGQGLTIWLRALDDDSHECDNDLDGCVASVLHQHFEAEGCCMAHSDDEKPVVVLKMYADFTPARCAEACGQRAVVLERATTTLAMAQAIPAERRRLVDASCVERFKAVKNGVEVAGIKRAGLIDAAVFASYAAWLEGRLQAGEETREFDGCKELQRRRSLVGGDLYKGDSFETISSAGANAAVIHYSPEEGKDSLIDVSQVYLCDTGAQYQCGTTDVTRTMHFAKPTDDERRQYTRVLQGHVALATAVFPEGTPGLMLDALARQPLWKDGLNYLHGTGHGQGAYLNVHEGPIGIGGGATHAAALSAQRKVMYLTGLEQGHYVSDEPGFYADGAWGFRIESGLVVACVETRYAWGARKWLNFEYVTPVPMCRALIDASLLSPDELAWVDAHHARCRLDVAPLLTAEALGDAEDAARALRWLQAQTRPLHEAD